MTYTSNKILKNVSYSHKVDFLTTEKLAGFKMKSWQVFKQKVGRFYPKKKLKKGPPPNSKIHSRPGLFMFIGVASIRGFTPYTFGELNHN